MLKFTELSDVDYGVIIDNMFYGVLTPTCDTYCFCPEKNCSYSSKELRQIADKLDKLNGE